MAGGKPKYSYQLNLSKKEQLKREVVRISIPPSHAIQNASECQQSNYVNLSKKELFKREVVRIYSCAIQIEVSGNTPPKCSKCRPWAQANKIVEEKTPM